VISDTTGIARLRQKVLRVSNIAHFGTECMYCQLYMCIQGSPVKNPNPSTLESDRPQRDRPGICVIAQQYSSATLSLRCHCHKKKFEASFKNVISSILLFVVS